jgi:multidrug resistance efflux pump
VESLKRTITPDELAVLSGSEDMRLTYENTRLDLKDKLKSVELALKQSTVARDNALKNRDLTLNQLSASRSSTELSLEQAERDYSKLVLKAPFDGSVTKIQASL